MLDECGDETLDVSSRTPFYTPMETDDLLTRGFLNPILHLCTDFISRSDYLNVILFLRGGGFNKQKVGIGAVCEPS